eukprot:gene2462-2697_t
MFAFLAFVALLGSTSAFLAPSSRASMRSLSMADDRSVALPYERRPAALDGTAPGDYGFDPAGFTSNPPKTYLIQRVILGDKKPGDLGLGQGGFNPFGFKYTDEEYFVKQEQEVKHGRLAMIASLGMLVQTNKFGINIPQQLAEAFSVPDERAILVGPSDLADFIPRI